jgi:hypothetical protein
LDRRTAQQVAGDGVPKRPRILQRQRAKCAPFSARRSAYRYAVMLSKTPLAALVSVLAFCWGVEALGTTDQRRQSIFRPIHFDSARHMVISYPEWDTIAVRSLISGYEQTIPTARHCESSAEICFEPRLEGDSIVYAWQDGARYAVPLDETLIN